MEDKNKRIRRFPQITRRQNSFPPERKNLNSYLRIHQSGKLDFKEGSRKIEYVEDKKKRLVTFCKRSKGIFRYMKRMKNTTNAETIVIIFRPGMKINGYNVGLNKASKEIKHILYNDFGSPYIEDKSTKDDDKKPADEEDEEEEDEEDEEYVQLNKKYE